MLSNGFEFVIRAGESISDPVTLMGYRVCGLYLPEFNDTPELTFQVSTSAAPDATYVDLFDNSGTAVEIESAAVTAAKDGLLMLPPETQTAFTGIMNLRVRTGTAGAPVVQDADRLIVVVASMEK